MTKKELEDRVNQLEIRMKALEDRVCRLEVSPEIQYTQIPAPYYATFQYPQGPQQYY
jgi:hypothetical protein